MKDPLQALLEGGAIEATAFPANSRYHGVGVAQLEGRDGEKLPYLRRRFVPQPERFSETQLHRVTQGDRLDVLAGRYLGDPELYWRLCDANRALRPDELLAPDRRLRITLPEGVPGAAE